MLARVSNLETFRRWRNDEDASEQDLIESLSDFSPSAAMLAGTAFHAALETAEAGETGILVSGNYRFHMDINAEIVLPSQREIRASKVYGPVTVTGKFDALDGLMIIDHKTTARFDAERYVTGYQWRFYLDIFGCDRFRWNVFEIRPKNSDDPEISVYEVFAFHSLEQTRYPGMHEDCMALALDFHETVSRVFPDYIPTTA